MSLHKKCLMKWFDNVTSIPTPSNVTWPQVRILTTSSSATVTKLCTYVGWERTIAEDRGCRGGYQAQLPIFMHFTLCQTRVSNEWPSYFMFKIQFTSIHKSWILLKFLTPHRQATATYAQLRVCSNYFSILVIEYFLANFNFYNNMEFNPSFTHSKLYKYTV